MQNGFDGAPAGGPMPDLRWLGTRLRRHRFEWPWAGALAARWWIPLGVLLVAPFPAFGWPLPERGVPIMWLLIAGACSAVAMVARASWPFAALLLWGVVRAAYHGYPLRSLQVLALMLMAGLLYAAARGLPDRTARRVAWAFVIGLAFEAVLGTINAVGHYPGMAWVEPGQAGKPMGLLTHPNYWGSYMAMGLPLVWALAGVPAALLVFALICRTISGGPVITASAAALVMAWPLFSRRVRLLVAAGGGAAVTAVMTLHEWRLSGRPEVWRAAWPDILRWPVMGEGVGQWRVWAEDYNTAHGSFFATLQAHNEPLQLWFELGLIGVAIAALWALQAGLAAWRVWQAAPAERLPGPWWAWGRAPLERAWIAVAAAALVNMWGSPVFHLPAQGALALFALARIQADASALGPVPAAGTMTTSHRARWARRRSEADAETCDR